MRNGGGGFAANIYRVMFEGGSQVTSHKSLKASCFKGSTGSGGGCAEIDGLGRSCFGIRYLTYDVSRRSG